MGVRVPPSALDTVAEDHLCRLTADARLEVYGQELSGETYATGRADLMLRGPDASHIAYADTVSEDGFEGQTFDDLLATPPFRVEWEKVENQARLAG